MQKGSVGIGEKKSIFCFCQEDDYPNRKKAMQIGGSIVIYIAILVLLLKVSSLGEQKIEMGAVLIEQNIVSGIAVQIQVLISVYLVMRFSDKGRNVGLFLNGYALLLSFAIVLWGGDMKALPWMFSYIGGLLVIQIIYRYSKKLDRKISQVNKQKEELNYMAFFDILTGLPNRKMLFKEIDDFIQQKSQQSFYVVFIDLDNFKKINDCMGHAVGDLLLKMVVEKWEEKRYEGDILARLGGDEFALIIPRDLSKEEVVHYLEGFKAVFKNKFQLKSREVSISASFGIATCPQDGENASELLKAADIAMYQVKHESKNGIAFFSKIIESEFVKKIQIEEELEKAIQKEEFSLVFQPQYTIDDYSMRGVEALLRWDSRVLGKVTPDIFLPIAEETGMIIPIGRWVLEEAMKKYKQMEEQEKQPFMLAINLSVAELMAPDFIQYVERLEKEYSFPIHKLEFEITESVFGVSQEAVLDVLTRLKEKQIKIALDDFGVGYASLKHIQMFPVDTLKIDKTFIDCIGEEKSKEAVVSVMISMAHYLGMRVVAEGVETSVQMNYLKNKRCDVIQGYFLAKPMSITQIQSILKGEEKCAQ